MSKSDPRRVYRRFAPNSDSLNYTFAYNASETAALHAALNNNALVDLDDLRRVSLWKLDRVLSVTDETLNALRDLANANGLKIDDDRSCKAIEMLVASDGIGFPMASAILKFVRPDVFPIIDVRAYRALTGTKPYYHTYTISCYLSYAKKLADIAQRTGRPLRDIDEQLYCFDEKFNGKI